MSGISDRQREENRVRQHRKAERGLARAMAQRDVAERMRRLLSDLGDRSDFTAEQVEAYRDEVKRLLGQIGKLGSNLFA